MTWFLWARHQGLDDQRCHGAASAALRAERKGTDPVTAAVAGARKARQENVDPSSYWRDLCNWYVWAKEREATPERSLVVAKAAALSVERGMTPTQALEVALAYERGENVRVGPPLSTRFMRDPGCSVLVIALIVLGLVVFSGLPLFFAVLAFFSFVIPLRAARFSGRFTWMMAIALAVDLAAIAAAAAGIRL